MVVIIGALFIFGCATMIRGTSQQLQISSEPDGALAKLSTGQSCVTPCQVKLKRKTRPVITFNKEGCDPGSVTVVPKLGFAGIMFGNWIDYGTGAAYSLRPNPAHVVMNCKDYY